MVDGAVDVVLGVGLPNRFEVVAAGACAPPFELSLPPKRFGVAAG